MLVRRWRPEPGTGPPAGGKALLTSLGAGWVFDFLASSFVFVSFGDESSYISSTNNLVIKFIVFNGIK